MSAQAQIELAGGLTLSYYEIGSGPPIVFLHGSGPGASGWSNFSQNAKAIAASGFRAIVPDMPGYGQSDKPADKAYTLDFFATSVIDLLQALNIENCALIGNSLGGALAIKLALDHPQRFQKLVLMAPGSLEETKTYMKMKGIQKMALAFMAAEPERKSLKDALMMMVYDQSFITDRLVDERWKIFTTQPKEVLTTMSVPHQAERLPELQSSVLAFWGMKDNLCPVSGADVLMRACPNARCVLISQCGHWVMVEHSALFNRLVLDFLHHG